MLQPCRACYVQSKFNVSLKMSIWVGSGESALRLGALGPLPAGPGSIDSQHPHSWSLQLWIIPVAGDPMPYFSLLEHCTCMFKYTWNQSTHTYKISKRNSYVKFTIHSWNTGNKASLRKIQGQCWQWHEDIAVLWLWFGSQTDISYGIQKQTENNAFSCWATSLIWSTILCCTIILC